MKKFLLISAALFALAACSEKNANPERPGEGPDPVVLPSPANCYIVSEEGPFIFDATVRGNNVTTEGRRTSKRLATVSLALVWQTEAGIVDSLSFNDGIGWCYLSGKKGSAVVAALNSAGKTIWSWHIWNPDCEIAELEGYDGAKVMNVNLGALRSIENATSIEQTYGMLYQWGRKDPFPGAPTPTGTTASLPSVVYDMDGVPVSISNSSWTTTLSNNVDFSIENPTVVISNMAQFSACADWVVESESNDALWGNPDGMVKDENLVYINKGFKTMYDPCPDGWRVPYPQMFKCFTSTGDASWVPSEFNIEGDWNFGWSFKLSEGVYSYFPATGRYDGSYAMLMGSVAGAWGNYWMNSPNSFNGKTGGACAVSFNTTTPLVGTESGAARADAYPIRCIKD